MGDRGQRGETGHHGEEWGEGCLGECSPLGVQGRQAEEEGRDEEKPKTKPQQKPREWLEPNLSKGEHAGLHRLFMAGVPACGCLVWAGWAGGAPCCQGAGQRRGAGCRQGPGHLHLTCRIWSLRLAWR